MFFDNIPAIPLGQFLNSSLGLFELSFRTVLGHPVFSFFAGILLLIVLFSFCSFLIHQGKSGRL